MNRIIVGALIVVTSLFMLSSTNIIAQEPCTADFDCDQDVDSGDVGDFLSQFGRSPFFNPCPSILCPIACEGTLSPLGRWCDQGDGTVKDMTTGLVWLKKADWGGQYSLWADFGAPNAHRRAAQLWDGSPWELAASLSDGSVEGDWRLPTKTELDNLTSGMEGVLSSRMRLFTGVQSDLYWTSTPSFIGTYIAWAVNFEDGGVEDGNVGGSLYVWPVRGGQ